MKIKLVFYDWLGKDYKGCYQTLKGVELSSGDFHSGTTFDGEVKLDSENEKELIEAMKNGYTPVFWVGLNKE